MREQDVAARALVCDRWHRGCAPCFAFLDMPEKGWASQMIAGATRRSDHFNSRMLARLR